MPTTKENELIEYFVTELSKTGIPRQMIEAFKEGATGAENKGEPVKEKPKKFYEKWKFGVRRTSGKIV